MAAVYWENPGYLGTIEDQGAEIVRIAHEHGALAIAGVDPITLGVLAPPGALGADIACGDIQCLGMHMHAGAGCSGFIAFRDDDPVFAQECPLELYTLVETETPGEWQVAEALPDRTSLRRSRAGQGLGRHRLGPVDHRGRRLHDGHGAAGLHASSARPASPARTTRPGAWRALPGVEVKLSPAFFKEFVVNFDGTGKTVAEVNEGLLEHAIFGGKDLSAEFPELGQSALYCVTEYHSEADIVELASALKEVLS